MDGTITQAELDKNVELRQEQLKVDPELAIMRNYIGAIYTGDTRFGLAHSLLPSGKGDPEVAQALSQHSTLKATSTGELGETKKANWDKLTALSQQYYPEEENSSWNDLETVLDLKANYVDTIIKAHKFPKQGNKLAKDPSVFQNAVDDLYIQELRAYSNIATLPGTITSLRKQLSALPATHPDRPNIEEEILAGQKMLQQSKDDLAEIQISKQKGFLNQPPSVNLQKMLTQLYSVPLGTGSVAIDWGVMNNLVKELEVANAIDYTASDNEIKKSFAKVPQRMEALYKKNMYALGTPGSPAPKSIEAFDPKAWGNKPQFIPFGSFSSNA